MWEIQDEKIQDETYTSQSCYIDVNSSRELEINLQLRLIYHILRKEKSVFKK